MCSLSGKKILCCIAPEAICQKTEGLHFRLIYLYAFLRKPDAEILKLLTQAETLQMLKSFQLTQSRHAQSKVLLAIRDLIPWWLIVSCPWFCPILIRGLRSRGPVFCVSEGTDSSNAWTVGRITWNIMLEETQDDFGTIHFRGPVFRAPSFSSFSSQLVPIQY